jgi:hypothetical protein
MDTMKTIPIEEKGVVWLVKEDGSIWSAARTNTVKRIRKGQEQMFQSNSPERQLSPWVSKSGYYIVSCLRDDKRPKMFVHRLIARAFVPGYSPELSVNHINGNKLDNRPENLEWITLAENSAHAWATGLVDLRGENAPNHKLTQRQVMHIRRALRLGVPANSLAIIANVNPSTIYQIEWGKRWKHITEEPTSC